MATMVAGFTPLNYHKISESASYAMLMRPKKAETAVHGC